MRKTPINMDSIVQPVTTTNGGAGQPSVRIAVKAVPGASRDAIAGPLGDRLKVRVAAPPEGGKANKAMEALIAAACGLPARSASVIVGQSRAQKVVEVNGIDAPTARARLGLS